ncbi:MAG TPA: hypothetical protein VNN62_21410 [Methylomirabilota bacterium]|nr:hypothetical protein [Methylomirabilota bacterium]
MQQIKLFLSAVASRKRWWTGCVLALLLTGKGCDSATWAAAVKPGGEEMASSGVILKLQNGLLTARITAAPLHRVMSELSRLSGARVVWLGQRDNHQVSVDFAALPVPEAIRRLLGSNNFLLMYTSTADEAKLTEIWVAPRQLVARQAGSPTRDSAAVEDDPDPGAVDVELEKLLESHLDTALHGADRDNRIEALGFLGGFIEHDPRVRPLLEQLAATESDPQVRSIAAEMLTGLEK